MAFLTIDGVDYHALGFTEEESEILGEAVDSFDGTPHIDGTERRVRSGILYRLSSTDYETLKAAVGVGKTVTVTGDAFPASIEAEVKITSAQFERVPDSTDHRIAPRVTIRYVEDST